MSTNNHGQTQEKHSNKSSLTSKYLEDCDPGATKIEVFSALKKVARTPKPSPKHGEQLDSTSKGT